MTNSIWPDELSRPTAGDIEASINAFWSTLAQLPSHAKASETLLLHSLIGELRQNIIEMMLAANGIRFPKNTRHLNHYLGESQRLALEKTLTMPRLEGHTASPADEQPAEYQETARSSQSDKAGWSQPLAATLIESLIGQAVALVVIYRWYAPQLAEKYGARLPLELENKTLTALHSELDAWPRAISTD
jgi:hypothetical protein